MVFDTLNANFYFCGTSQKIGGGIAKFTRPVVPPARLLSNLAILAGVWLSATPLHNIYQSAWVCKFSFFKKY
jgi:hypothetical protein